LAKLIYIVRPTGCTTGCKSVYTMEQLDVGLHKSNMLNPYNRLYNRLVQQKHVCIHDAAGCATGCTTGCTTGCIVYTDIFPVVSCIRGLRKEM